MISLSEILSKIKELKRSHYDLKEDNDINIYCNDAHLDNLKEGVNPKHPNKIEKEGITLDVTIWDKPSLMITDKSEKKLKMIHNGIIT